MLSTLYNIIAVVTLNFMIVSQLWLITADIIKRR